MAGPVSYWVTGPCPIWIKAKQGSFFDGSGQGPFFLGYAESFPRMEFRPGWEPVMSDPTGSQKPADFSFESMDAVLAFNLTLWDERTAQGLEVFPGPGIGVSRSPGTWLFDDMGSLMMTERWAYEAWVQFPFGGFPAAGPTATHPFMASLPNGYHFPCCLHLGPSSPQPGAKPFKRQMVWLAWPQMDFASRALRLFDYDMSALSNAAAPTITTGVGGGSAFSPAS